MLDKTIKDRIWANTLLRNLCAIFLLALVFLAFSINEAFAQCQKKKTKNLIEQGNRLFNEKNIPEALARYEQALESEPNCSLAYFNKGQAQRGLNRIDEAIGSLERAANLNYPDTGALNLALAAAYLSKGKERSADALTYAEKAVQANRNSLEGWYIIAVSNQNLGKATEEARGWAQVVRLSPNNAEARRYKGAAHFRLREYKDSLAEFQKLTELEPKNPQNFLVMSDLYRLMGEDQSAIESAQKALKLKPDMPDAYYALGNSYLNLKQYINAANSFQLAINYKTEYSAESFYNKGLAHLALGEYEDAVNAFKQALPQQSKVYTAGVFKNYVFKALGSSHGQLGNYREAITNLEQAKATIDDATIDIDLSWWYSLLGDNNAAIKAATRAIEKSPQQSMGYTNRCRANLTLGRADEALIDCEKALQLKPDDGETLFYYGRVLRNKKRVKEADVTNRKAIVKLEADLGVQGEDERQIFSTSVRSARGTSDDTQAAQNDDVDKLLAVNVTSPYMPYILGNAYFDDKQLNKAINAYQISLRRAPRFPLARFNLGIVHFNLKDKEAALQQYRELARIDNKRAEDLKKVIDGKQ